MDLKRLLDLAGIQLSEATMSKYNEPKANHTKKTGGKDVKKPKEGKGKSADKSKYSEPKAGKGPKKAKEVKAPEGKSKVPPKSKYTDHNSTK